MLSAPLVVGAFVAGLGMFVAPCTLPLVPGYLAFIGGGRAASRSSVFGNALAYVLGFSLVFIILGTFAVTLGHVLGPWRLYLPRAAGAVTILFGLVMLGVRVPFLSVERHASMPKLLRVGSWPSSFVLGALFATGWSPCIGPLLGTILLFASSSSTVLQGALLLAVFSAGLGLPFLLCAVLLEWASPVVGKVARLVQFFNTLSALVIIGIGVLMLTGQTGLLVDWGFGLFGPSYQALLKYL